VPIDQKAGVTRGSASVAPRSSPAAGVLRLAFTAWLLAFAFLAGTATAPRSVPPQAAANRAAGLQSARPLPRLAVLIVVDQMRADYVERFRADWTAGLKRLVSRGAWFRQAAYPYLTTVTCVGHATISTGAFPHTHGIIQNAWPDRNLGHQVACTEDDAAMDFGYPEVVKGRDSGQRLLVPGFADEMRQQRSAHVATLALKARAAIMLAGHGGDAVVWLDEPADAWDTSSFFAPAVPDAVKTFVASNAISSDFGKAWTRLLPARRYVEADAGLGEAPPSGWTRTFPHALRGAGDTPDAAFRNQWESSPFADAYVGRLAARLAESFALGKHEGTDVLAVSFSSPDLVGHAFGPRSQEIRDMYAHLDRTIGELLQALDRLVGRDEYVVALTGDHGVSEIPEQLEREHKDAGNLEPAKLVATIESAASAALGPGKYVLGVNGNDVYFEDRVYERLQSSQGATEKVLEALRAVPGIDRVYRSEDVRESSAGPDARLRAAAMGYFPGRSGDLILVLRPGWIYRKAGTGTTHGTSSAADQHVPILLLGPGIKPGQYWQSVTPADVVPTLAVLCGISMPHAEGHALQEALVAR
jgi:predicted AlkP superfamily pyrophosphatase or phosphodiesterase